MKNEDDIAELLKAALAYQHVVREHRDLSTERPCGSWMNYPKSFTDKMAVVMDKRKRAMDALLAAAMNLPRRSQERRYTGKGCPGIKKPNKPLTERTARKEVQ